MNKYELVIGRKIYFTASDGTKMSMSWDESEIAPEVSEIVELVRDMVSDTEQIGRVSKDVKLRADALLEKLDKLCDDSKPT